jgi:hypothetical protein
MSLAGFGAAAGSSTVAGGTAYSDALDAHVDQ